MREPIPKPTKHGRGLPDERWIKTKQDWFEANAPDYDDWYQCNLCPYAVHRDELIHDHIRPVGSHPELKYVISNLQASHGLCNSRKGSMSMEAYLLRYRPNGEWSTAVMIGSWGVSMG